MHFAKKPFTDAWRTGTSRASRRGEAADGSISVTHRLALPSWRSLLILGALVGALTLAGVALADGATADTPSVEGYCGGCSAQYSAWAIGAADPWTSSDYYQMDIYLINNSDWLMDDYQYNGYQTNYVYGNQTPCHGAIVRSLVTVHGDDCECDYEGGPSDRNYDCSY